jgi:uncharacterized protein (DUF302 family)
MADAAVKVVGCIEELHESGSNLAMEALRGSEARPATRTTAEFPAQQEVTMYRAFVAFTAISIAMTAASAGTIKPQSGWVVIDTPYPFVTLVDRLEAAVKAEHMSLVTAASASEGAKTAGFQIPGNRVVGVFRNDFARRMLDASISAGIEAPIRFYVTENPDHTATLSYKKPTTVFAPHGEEGKDALKVVANELDEIFERIAAQATKEE